MQSVDGRAPQFKMPQSVRECFFFDIGEVVPDPGSWKRRFTALFMSPQYGMPVLMRLTQYCFLRGMTRRAELFRTLNQILFNFEHGIDPHVDKGVVFHHTNVCITSQTIIESGVHIYRGVLFGMKNGGAPVIRRDAKIASHASVVGPVTVGEHAIVGVGAVVVSDVPEGKVVTGVPARVTGEVTEQNYSF
jgi:serine acetyltransferase